MKTQFLYLVNVLILVILTVIALMEDAIVFLDLRDMIVASVSTFNLFYNSHKYNFLVCLNYTLFSHSFPVSCPNNCGGHGECLRDGTCACENGYTGTDCSTGILFIKIIFYVGSS